MLKNEMLKKEKCAIDSILNNNRLQLIFNEIKNNGIVTESMNISANAIEKIRIFSKFLILIFIITLLIMNKFSAMAIRSISRIRNNFK
jgi:hypothetical protein